MKQKLFFSFVAIFFFCVPVWAQKTLSNAEKMGYSRTNKYWGPGTFYLYAPGKPNNKMADNSVSHMRDLTGISAEDFYTEIAKQGFVEVPKKEEKKWFNDTKNKNRKFYYSPDKSYILEPGIKDMFRSPATEDGKYAYASDYVSRFVLIPKADSLKVINEIWQFLRDLNEMKAILSIFGSNFKNADTKSYPIQRASSSGWTGMRAGSYVLVVQDGKSIIKWENNETIIRRTIGKPEFELHVLGQETDFVYSLVVRLQKEGYVLIYNVLACNFGDLEPGNNWTKEYPNKVKEYNLGVKKDKDNVDIYKKAPFPPVLEDLNKLLHIK